MEAAGSLLLAEVMLWLVYATVAVAVAVTVFSAVRPLLIAPRRQTAGRGWLIVAFTALLLVVTWLLGSDRPLVVNGTVFSDAFWLKSTDMLIVSSLILIVVAVALVCFGVTGLNRKIGNGKAVGK